MKDVRLVSMLLDSPYDAGKLEQNWNNGKIKGYDLVVST